MSATGSYIFLVKTEALRRKTKFTYWNVEPSYYRALILFLRRRDGINKIFPFKTSDAVQYIYVGHMLQTRRLPMCSAVETNE